MFKKIKTKISNVLDQQDNKSCEVSPSQFRRDLNWELDGLFAMQLTLVKCLIEAVGKDNVASLQTMEKLPPDVAKAFASEAKKIKLDEKYKQRPLRKDIAGGITMIAVAIRGEYLDEMKTNDNFKQSMEKLAEYYKMDRGTIDETILTVKKDYERALKEFNQMGKATKE